MCVCACVCVFVRACACACVYLHKVFFHLAGLLLPFAHKPAPACARLHTRPAHARPRLRRVSTPPPVASGAARAAAGARAGAAGSAHRSPPPSAAAASSSITPLPWRRRWSASSLSSSVQLLIVVGGTAALVRGAVSRKLPVQLWREKREAKVYSIARLGDAVPGARRLAHSVRQPCPAAQHCGARPRAARSGAMQRAAAPR